MGLITLFFRSPLLFFMVAIPLLYSIIAHEVAHGWAAYLFGDDTAKRTGRLSLDPMQHLDPMGTLMLFFVGFGWAKPVPVDFYRLRPQRLGMICVSLAGCLTNIVIAAVALSLLKSRVVGANTAPAAVLMVVARINIILGALNLIPIPPLDGSRILTGLLPPDAQRALARIEPYGFFILVIMLFTGLLDPVIFLVQKVIIGLLSVVL